MWIECRSAFSLLFYKVFSNKRLFVRLQSIQFHIYSNDIVLGTVLSMVVYVYCRMIVMAMQYPVVPVSVTTFLSDVPLTVHSTIYYYTSSVHLKLLDEVGMNTCYLFHRLLLLLLLVIFITFAIELFIATKCEQWTFLAPFSLSIGCQFIPIQHSTYCIVQYFCTDGAFIKKKKKSDRKKIYKHFGSSIRPTYSRTDYDNIIKN